MIVNSLNEGWEVLYQRSHANLAAMLVAGWRKHDHIPRWTELLIATAQHDDQEMLWDQAQHLTELGAPVDFMEATLDTNRLNARFVIDNAYRQGVWIALLISRHNSFLYEPMRGQDKQMDAFLDEQREKQEAWRKLLNCSKTDLERAYSFLGWGDRLSLILCRRELPGRGRYLDIAPGPDGEMIRVTQRDDETVSLDPWVLEEDEMTVSVETRQLKQLKFENEAEFGAVLNAAPIVLREWRFVR
jgi:hypothetical protein